MCDFLKQAGRALAWAVLITMASCAPNQDARDETDIGELAEQTGYKKLMFGGCCVSDLEVRVTASLPAGMLASGEDPTIDDLIREIDLEVHGTPTTDNVLRYQRFAQYGGLFPNYHNAYYRNHITKGTQAILARLDRRDQLGEAVFLTTAVDLAAREKPIPFDVSPEQARRFGYGVTRTVREVGLEVVAAHGYPVTVSVVENEPYKSPHLYYSIGEAYGEMMGAGDVQSATQIGEPLLSALAAFRGGARAKVMPYQFPPKERGKIASGGLAMWNFDTTEATLTFLARNGGLPPSVPKPVVEPAPGAVSSATLSLQGSAKPGLVVHAVQGDVEVTAQASTTGEFSLVMPLEPNAFNIIRVYAVDDSGSVSGSVLVKVLQDAIAPDLQAAPAFPTPVSYPPSFALGVTDSLSGVDAGSWRVWSNGLEVTATFSATAQGIAGPGAAFPWEDGTYSFVFAVADLVGNRAQTATSLVLDRQVPVSNFVLTGKRFDDAAGRIWVTGEVTASFSSNEQGRIEILLNGQPVAETAFALPQLPRVFLQWRAFDLAGNAEAWRYADIRFDGGLDVALDFPVPSLQHAGGRVDRDGISYVRSDTAFEARAEQSYGPGLVTLFFTDAAGTTVEFPLSSTRAATSGPLLLSTSGTVRAGAADLLDVTGYTAWQSVVIDDLPPQLTLTMSHPTVSLPPLSSSPISVPADTKFTLVAADDPGGVGMGALEYSVAGGAFVPYLGTFEMPQPGLSSLMLRATDLLGNRTEMTYQFVIEPVPFVTRLEVGDPKVENNGELFVLPETLLSFSLENRTPNAQIFYTIVQGPFNAPSATAGPLVYSAPFTLSTEASYRIDFRAVDESYSSTEVLRQAYVTVDATGPETNLAMVPTQPLAGEENRYCIKQNFSLALTAYDPAGVLETRVGLNGATMQRYQGPIPLADEGNADAVFYSFDRLLNQEPERTFKLYVDGTPPEVTHAWDGPLYDAGAGEPLRITQATRLAISAADVCGVERVEYRLDNGPFTTYAEALSFVAGDHELVYWATDGVMNSVAQPKLLVRVDGLGPVVSASFGEPHRAGSDAITVGPATPVLVSAADTEGTPVVLIEVSSDGTVWAPWVDSTTVGTGAMVYKRFFRATDALGNTGAAVAVEAVVDVIPPAPQITVGTPRYPLSEGWLVARETVITLDPGGAAGETVVASYTVETPGGEVIVQGNAPAVITAPVAGPQIIRLRARDDLGNAAETSLAVDADWDAPKITILEPAAGLVTSVAEAQLKATVDDAQVTVAVHLNGTSVASTLSGNQVTAQLVWGHADGNPENFLTLEVTDRLGRHAIAERVAVFDPNPPVLSVETPRFPLYTSYSTVKLTGTVTDATAVRLEVDGRLVAVADGSFAALATVNTEGGRDVVVMATDEAGLTASFQGSWTYDPHPPVLAILSPGEGFAVDALEVPLTISVDDLSPVLLSVGTATRQITTGTQAAALFDVPLEAEGENHITVTALDAAGWQSRQTRMIIRDTQAPLVWLAQAGVTMVTDQPQFLLAGAVTDVTAVHLEIDGEAAVLDNAGRFAHEITLAPGDNQVAITATDLLGHVLFLTRTVRYEPPNTGPLLTVRFTSPAEGAVFYVPQTRVEGEVTEDPSVKVLVNGFPAQVTGGRFSASVTLAAGDNTIVAVAFGFDQQTAATLRLHYDDSQAEIDAIPPTVAIIAPLSGTFHATGEVEVRGVAQDERGIARIVVNGIQATLSGSGNEQSFVAMAPLVEGPNTFYVEAFDTSNNRTVASSEVVRDSLAPYIQVTTPGDGASVHETPIPLEGSVSDANLADFSINGVNVVLGGGLFATTAELSSGENKFILRARDLAGNTTEIERRVTLIGQAPTLTFVSPQNGHTFKHSPIPVTVTAQSIDGTPIESVTITNTSGSPSGGTAGEGALGGGTYSATVELIHGVNTLTAIATAGSGAKRTVSIQVEYQDPLQTPLEVAAVSPATAAKKIHEREWVKLTFNKAIQPESVVENIKVFFDGAEIAMAVNVLPGNEMVVLSPLEPYPYKKRATVSVLSGIQAAVGAGLTVPFTSYFDVREKPTIIAGVVYEPQGSPLVGATVRFDEGWETQTDDTGNFSMEFDCQEQHPANVCISGGMKLRLAKEGYHGATRMYQGDRNEINLVPPLFLTPFSPTGIAGISASADTLLSFDEAVPGFSLEIKAGTANFTETGLLSGAVRATEVLPQLMPVGSEHDLPIGYTVAMHPPGIELSVPATVTFKNTGLAEGQRVVIYDYDREQAMMRPISLGRVVNDRVVSDEGVRGLDYLGYFGLSNAQAEKLDATLNPPPPPEESGENSLLAGSGSFNTLGAASVQSRNAPSRGAPASLTNLKTGYTRSFSLADAMGGGGGSLFSQGVIGGRVMTAPIWMRGEPACQMDQYAGQPMCQPYCSVEPQSSFPECENFDAASECDIGIQNFRCDGVSVFAGVPVQLQAYYKAGDITNALGRYSVIFSALDGEYDGYMMAMIPMAGYEARGFPVGLNVGLGNSNVADILVDVKTVTGLIDIVNDAGQEIEIAAATSFDDAGNLLTITDFDLMTTSVYLFKGEQFELPVARREGVHLLDAGGAGKRYTLPVFGSRSVGMRFRDFSASLEVRTPGPGQEVTIWKKGTRVAGGKSDVRNLLSFELSLFDGEEYEACLENIAPDKRQCFSGTLMDTTANAVDFTTGLFGPGWASMRGPGLNPGDVYTVVAVNRATGYVGMVKGQVQPGGNATVVAPYLALRPPALEVRIERTYKPLGAKNALQSSHLVGPHGVALQSDKSVVVTSNLRSFVGGKVVDIPKGIVGYKGRLIVMDEHKFTREVQRFDIQPGYASAKVDLFDASGHDIENFVVDVDPYRLAPTFEGRTSEATSPYKLKRFVQVAHMKERLVPDSIASDMQAAMNSRRCWHKEEFDATFRPMVTTSGKRTFGRICASEVIYSTYGFTAETLQVNHAGGSTSTPYSAEDGGEVPGISESDEGIDLFFWLDDPEFREYAATGDKLFIMRFNDGSATGQLKGIKKKTINGQDVWVVCDLDAAGNALDDDTHQCVSMATFSLTGVSLDDLLFVELYLKNDPGNVLWKWYMNLEIEFMFLNAQDGTRSNVFLPTDGSDPSKHKVLLVKASGKLGKNIDVVVAVKDQAGNLNHPPDATAYPPASVELKMVRYSDDPKSVNYDYFVLENDAPIIVTDGTLASIAPGFAGHVLYDPPLHCVSASLAATFDAGGFFNVLSKDGRACIFTPRLKLDVNYPNGSEQDVKSFVLRWRPELPPRHDTQFWVRIDGLHPIAGVNDHYLIEVDEGGPELPPFGRARPVGRGQRNFYVDSAGQTSFSLSFLDQMQVPEAYNPDGTGGCQANNATQQRNCIRPYRLRLIISYVSEQLGVIAKEPIEKFEFVQSITDTAVQEYWDHYPFLDPRFSPRRINCEPNGRPNANGLCELVHSWPNSEVIRDPVLSATYNATGGCGANGLSNCRNVVSANYANVSGIWLSRGNPLAFAESVKEQYSHYFPDTNLTPRVTSGWRNPQRNEAARGVINSLHQWGDALDLVPEFNAELGIVVTSPQTWCQLGAAAFLAASSNPFELLIENRRSKPANTPDVYHRFTQSQAECESEVEREIASCLVRYHPNGPYLPSQYENCSPDHVHVVRRNQ